MRLGSDVGEDRGGRGDTRRADVGSIDWRAEGRLGDAYIFHRDCGGAEG